jgi:site-specific DNA-methyltransferase (adenine-specific)
MSVQIIHGDSRAALEYMPSNSIDSVVTDPPYALVSISKRFGKEGAAPAKAGATGAYQRASAGFMGKTWDTGETAFDPAFWADVLRVLKPGGHVLAFGGTRTYHRLACAVEDAGFEIRDQIGWLYGSGFPKSHNQSGYWEGWGTALKPAWEPIVVARKPLAGTVAGNLALWGVGALNIDGGRIAIVEGDAAGYWPADNGDVRKIERDVFGAGQTGGARSQLGRWPANVIHSGEPDVLEALGAPSRFFYCAKASRADRDHGLDAFEKKPAGLVSNTSGQHMTRRDEGYEVAKRANAHPTVKPTDLMRYLCRLVTPPGGTVLDPFMGSGSTGRGAVMEGFNFIGCELDADYTAIARARIAAVTPAPTEGVFA